MRAEERQRRRFSEILAHGLSDRRLRALMSMRTDFLGALQNDEPLFAVHRQIDVPPLREAELREVVSRPAELLSARFETDDLGGHHRPAHGRGFGQGRGRAAAARPTCSTTCGRRWSSAATACCACPRNRSSSAACWSSAPMRSWPASRRRGNASPHLHLEARDRARGRRADAAARRAFRVLGRGMAAGLRACRPSQPAAGDGDARGRRDLCRGGARGDLPALGQAARLDRRGARIPRLEKRARSRAPARGKQRPTVRRTTRC